MKNKHLLHLGIAEAGKIEALAGKHDKALEHYREAIKIAVSISAPEVFFRHYTQCVLESLELSGDYEEAIEYYRSADEHYKKLALEDTLHSRDHADQLEKLGVLLIKAGQIGEAKAELKRAIELAGNERKELAETCLGWLEKGFKLDAMRLLNTQKKHKYFTVRRDQINKSIATPLSSIAKSKAMQAGLAGLARSNSAL